MLFSDFEYYSSPFFIVCFALTSGNQSEMDGTAPIFAILKLQLFMYFLYEIRLRGTRNVCVKKTAKMTINYFVRLI